MCHTRACRSLPEDSKPITPTPRCRVGFTERGALRRGEGGLAGRLGHAGAGAHSATVTSKPAHSTGRRAVGFTAPDHRKSPARARRGEVTSASWVGLRLVQFDGRLTHQRLLRRSGAGAGASLGAPSATRLNSSASSRHALASLSIKARCLGSSAFAAERRHSSA